MKNEINLSELATRESGIVEWKENVARVSDVIETIVAFSNDFLNIGGGYIVCGAKEIKDANGFQAVEYVGLTAQRLKEVKEQVINDCTNAMRVNPPINPKVDEIEIEGDLSRKILVFTIDATSYAHSYKNDRSDIPRYFIRTDFSTKEATNGFIRELLRRKNQIEPWDKRGNVHSSISDIDELVLRQYLQNMKLWFANKAITDYLSSNEKIEEFIPPLLFKSGIDKPQFPKNFTLMIFGKKPIDFCAGAYSIFTIFDGVNKGKQQAETQWLTGTIVEQANKLIELLNIESTIAIDKNSENTNQIKYPMVALKEAVVNAIVHRDYEIDQPTRVEVYSDRIEIYSPGGLPFNLNVAKFKEGKAKASWRNQSFGRIFHKLNLAQHQGSGIEKIISAMKDEGCPSPIFDIDDNSVTCVIPAHPRHRIMKQISESESDIVIRDYASAYKKLHSVLDSDIYNYRAMELFCEVNILMNSPKNVFELISKKDFDFNQIRSNTLVIISETLSLIKNDKGAESLSRKLLEIALNGRLEEKQLLKVAYTLKKFGDDKAVVDFVNKTIVQYPSLANNSFFLDQKGRALIDLAKLCEKTYYESQNNGIKNKAKLDFEFYLLDAKKSLNLAFENSENIVDKDYIQKALWYIQNEMMPFLSGHRNNNTDSRTIFVTAIPLDGSKDDLKKLFSKYGEIEKITLNSKQNRENQVAYILYSDKLSSERAFLDRFSNKEIRGVKVYTQQYFAK
jgi:ATP-dependent DNA helicase RecG